jgi:hypothetical protein
VWFATMEIERSSNFALVAGLLGTVEETVRLYTGIKAPGKSVVDSSE